MGITPSKIAMVERAYCLMESVPEKVIKSSFNRSCLKAFKTDSNFDEQLQAIAENESIEQRKNIEAEGRHRDTDEISALEQLIMDADVTSYEIENFENLNLDSGSESD